LLAFWCPSRFSTSLSCSQIPRLFSEVLGFLRAFDRSCSGNSLAPVGILRPSPVLVVFRPTVPGFAFVGLRHLVEFFRSPPFSAVSSRARNSFVIPVRGGFGAISTGVSSRRFPGDNTQLGSSLAHVRSICRRSIRTMSRSARVVSSAAFLFRCDTGTDGTDRDQSWGNHPEASLSLKCTWHPSS